MNLRDFKYLVAVAEHRHFGKAAEVCFVSQPALSMQLQKLERELGVQLLERSNKHVMVTEVGKDIVERARKILQDAKEIEEVVQSYQDPFSGSLRLGAFPTLAPYFFPTIVPKLNKFLPKLKLFLVEEKTDILLKKIDAGEIDAGLLALPVQDERLEVVPLFEDPFLLAVSTNHPLATQKQVKQEDIAKEQLLLLEEGHCLRDQALSICSLMGANADQDFRATSLETLRQMVASNMGITLIPKLAAHKYKDIVYIPIDYPEPSRTIALVWRKTSARGECFKQMVSLMSKVESFNY